MRVLMIEPNRQPYSADIPCEPADIMQTIGGLYTITNLGLEEDAEIFCNDLFSGLPANRMVGDQMFYGTFFIAGHTRNEYGDGIACSLKDEQIARYTEMLRLPDMEQDCGISDSQDAEDCMLLSQ